MRIDLHKVAERVSPETLREYLSKLEGAELDFEDADFEFFSSPEMVEEQTMLLMDRAPVHHAGRR